MNRTIIKSLICLSLFSAEMQAQKISGAIQDIEPSSVRIGGYLGKRMDACVQRRVKEQDVHHFTAPFYSRTETRLWQSEFWGKWTLGAISFYRYAHDPILLDSIRTGVKEILGAQQPDGYIGNYSDAAQLQQWDIWGRKYTLLGLLAYCDLTGDEKTLNACRRLADHLLSQTGPGKTDIVTTGNYRGMPSCSILEPMIYLYRRTGEQRYLDFAEYIVAQWETPQGPQLISKAEAGIHVADRFPHPGSEENWTDNGGKAYEMMSCYEGLLELYKITGRAEYLSAVEKAARDILDTEINIAGSGTASECWYHGKKLQTRPAFHTMETCVTVSWMKLCKSLLSLTGNPLYADLIEKTACNALLASMKDDATQTAMYSPLVGQHFFSSGQCGMHINCCSANAPRGFAMLPQFAVMQSRREVFINLYTDLSAELSFDKKQQASLTQQTAYPESGDVAIRMDAPRPVAFTLALRIPAWCGGEGCRAPAVSLNGEPLTGVTAGAYFKIDRIWKKGDAVQVTFDVRARIVRDRGYAALVKGPVVLARDSRFADGTVDEEAVIVEKNGFAELTPVQQKPAGMWMAFTAPVKLGVVPHGVSQVHFCDFGSAGNAWTIDSRHRVWLPEVLDTYLTAHPQACQ
jgi:DUF1680 family protein